MASSVRAATLLGPERLEVRSYPYPDELEPGAVLLRMLASGICGTDKHTFRGETEQYAGTEKARSTPYPIIQGHENVGVVAADRRRRRARPRRVAAGGGRPRGAGAQPRLRGVPHVRPRLPLLPLPPARELRQLAHEQRRAASVRRLGGVPLPQAAHRGVPRARRPPGRRGGADRDLRGHAQPRARRPPAEPGRLPAGRAPWPSSASGRSGWRTPSRRR